MTKRFKEKRGLWVWGLRMVSILSFLFFVWGVGPFSCLALKDEILFMVYDTGETNALKPVFKVLEERKIPYQILASGKAVELLQGHPTLSKTSFEAELKGLPREGQLTSAQYAALVEVHPQKVIFTSMASRAQGDLAMKFKERGAWVGAYYDNFDDVGGKEFVVPFLGAVKELSGYVTPSKRTMESFERLNQQRGETVPIVVLGQPSLETWQEAHKNQILKETVQKALWGGDQESHQFLLFAGGYDPTYEDAFRIFIKGVKESGLEVLVTPHPKTDGSLEAGIVKEAGMEGQVRVILSQEQKGILSTMNLSTLGPQYLVCHRSTVCMQGLAVGIPGFYVAGPDYTNFAIESGIAPRVSTAVAVGELLSQKGVSKHPPHLEDLGIPSDSASKIADYLVERLRAG